jgi:hypothetical protein
MSAYTVAARIERVAPHLVIGQARDGYVETWAVQSDISNVDVDAVDDGDPFVDRLIAISERWSQLTFFLFNAEGWR